MEVTRRNAGKFRDRGRSISRSDNCVTTSGCRCRLCFVRPVCANDLVVCQVGHLEGIHSFRYLYARHSFSFQAHARNKYTRRVCVAPRVINNASGQFDRGAGSRRIDAGKCETRRLHSFTANSSAAPRKSCTSVARFSLILRELESST